MNTEHAKLLQVVLAEMGFQKSSDHESCADLWHVTIKPGVELQVSHLSGKGVLFLHDEDDDVSMVDVPVAFGGVGHLNWFIEAIRQAEAPVIFYSIGETMDSKTACNRENGSASELWNRKCWVADSLVSLVSSHIDTLAAKYAPDLNADTDPDSPLWKLVKDLEYYCEELRVKNGLRHPGVLNRDEKFPVEIDA